MKYPTLFLLALFSANTLAGAAASSSSAAASSSSGASALANQSNRQSTNVAFEARNIARQRQSQMAKGGAGLADANNQNNVINHSEFNQYDRIQHPSPQTSSNCINGVCKATSAISFTGGYDEWTGNSVNVGLVIPFGGGGRATDRAMRIAAQDLAQASVRAEEKHQADMATLCMGLHQIMRQVGIDKPMAYDDPNSDTPTYSSASIRGRNDLWARCAGFEHLSGAYPGHNGRGDPRQVSPHSSH